MQDGERQRGIALLLADWWQHRDAAVAQFDRGRADPPRPVADLDAMQTLDGDLAHRVGDRVPTVAGQPIDATAHDEVRAEVVSQAKQLVDVALAVADMDAAARRPEQRRRLTQVLQPAKALLLLDRHAGRIDLALECVRAFELFPRPELHCSQPEWQTVGGHGERSVHEQAAQRVHADLTGLVATAVHAAGDADGLPALALEGELGRVLQDQHGAVAGPDALARCREVP